MTLLVWTIIIPLIGGLLSYFLDFEKKELSVYLIIVSMSLGTLILLLNTPQILTHGTIVEEYSWIPSMDISFDLSLDGLSFLYSLTVMIISVLCQVYALRMEKKKPKKFFSLLDFFAVGMLGLCLSTNFIQFYMFLEVMIIPAYFLISYYGHTKNKGSIGLKYFIYMHIGALLILISILWIYSTYSSFEFIELESKTIPWNISSLFLTGFLIKMGVFPLHNWLPDAHSEAPSTVSAMLSGLMVGMGGYGIIRILLIVFKYDFTLIKYLALASMIYGGFMALVQDDIKRMLAYSTVSQMGYVLLGIDNVGGALHVITHALCKSLLFLCAGTYIYSVKTRKIKELKGVMKKLFLTSACLITASFSLIGMPLLNGFVSELLIFEHVIEQGFFMISAAIFAGVITLSYFIILVKSIISQRNKFPKIRKPSFEAKIVQVILAVLIIITGVYPEPLIKLLNGVIP